MRLIFLKIECNQILNAGDAIPFGVGVAPALPAGVNVLAAWVGDVNGLWCAQVQVSVSSFDNANVNGFFFNPLSVAIPANIEATIVIAISN